LVGIGDWEEREVGSGSGDEGGAEDGPGLPFAGFPDMSKRMWIAGSYYFTPQ
jgi:hypothetical protein